MEFVKPDKNIHTYVVGIDFGHGETSADICAIQWDVNYSQLAIPESIEIFNGVPAIKSVLLIEKIKGENVVENIYIGEQAINRYANPKFHKENVEFQYYSYFKKIPSLMSETDKNVMRLFMKEVYNQIRKQRSELTDENHLVYIACPSNPKDWTENEIDKYAEIALEAGLPLAKINEKNFGIIRESRAAFLKARSNPQYQSSIKEGLLLIDFGSSTVDITYYSSKYTERPVDDGDYCGASNVEIGIVNDLKKKYPNVSQAMSEFSSAETAILLSVRDRKEYFYTYDSEDMEVVLNLRKLTNGKIVKSVEHYYSDDEIKSILAKYVVDIKRAFEKFKDAYLKEKPIKLIFLTGGASRMDFVQQIAREVFNYNDEFYKETNPSLTISNGIALAGRADLRTFSMEQALLNSDVIKNTDFANSVVEKAASKISEVAIDKIASCYSSFASRSYNDNLGSLESDVKKQVDSISASSHLTSAYNEVLRDVANTKIIPTINNIVKDYFPDFAIEGIKSSSYFSLSVNTSSISTISSVISSSLSKIEEGVIEGAAKLLFNLVTGTTALVEGAIIKTGIGIINLFRDKPIKNISIEEFVDDVTVSFRNKSTKLTSTQRTEVKNAFNEKKSSFKSSIASDIKYKLKTETSLLNQINSKGREEIKNYIREQIQNARIMLN